MAIVTTTMSSSGINNPNHDHMSTITTTTASTTVVNKDEHDHEHDMVMPGFRFHPTEEELIEFYLRRKVEGRRFNVELITFLDLYRYDPWELPAMAAIGEKEWYFYVPRDRKYRNGDRPNRVTNSGYWKATGADRMIRNENSRSIGLKKTLVFYSGKAPKGIRTSWIMNEYRLPQHETERYNKTEISLCRVYKRSGVEDHPSLPRSLPLRATACSSRSSAPLSDKKQNMEIEKLSTETDGISSCSDVTTTALALSNHNHGNNSSNNAYQHHQMIVDSVPTTISSASISLPLTIEQDQGGALFLNQCKQSSSSLVPTTFVSPIPFTSSLSSNSNPVGIDDLHRLVCYQTAYMNQYQQQQQYFSQYHQQHQSAAQLISSLMPQSQAMNVSLQPPGFSDRLWEWSNSPLPPESNSTRDYNNQFK